MFWDRFFPSVLQEVDWIFKKIRKNINVVISGQEVGGNASQPTVTNPTVINFKEVSGPTRVSGVYLLRNKLFFVHLLGIRQTEILDVLGQIFSFGVTRNGLDLQENKKKKINVVISGQEMGGNASLSTVTNPTVINSTKVSGPTRVSRIYILRNKLFLVHLLGIGKRRFWMF
jgi:hypothetical protein